MSIYSTTSSVNLKANEKDDCKDYKLFYSLGKKRKFSHQP